MQRILVPTDFSPIADNALNYAIELAAKFNGELYLYHVYHINKFDYKSGFSDDEQPYFKKIEQRMNLTKLKFQEKVAQNGLTMHTNIEEDNITSLFKRKVIKYDIDLIVMGSKGATGLEKAVFGSVAATALETAKVPVLIVPATYAFLPIEQIVLAVDAKMVAPRVLAPLQALSSELGAKVNVLNVNTGSDKDALQEIDVYLEGVETAFHEVPVSKNINESINEFVKKDKCDLLCMIRRKKSFLQSLLRRSITKTQVYGSEIPLLVLPEK